MSSPLDSNPGFCSECKLFDLHSFTRDFTEYRGYRWSKILNGAAEDCRLCSMLKGRFRRYFALNKGFEASWIHLRLDSARETGRRDVALHSSGSAADRLDQRMNEEGIVGLPSAEADPEDGDSIALHGFRSHLLPGTTQALSRAAYPQNHGRLLGSRSIEDTKPLKVQGIKANVGFKFARGPRLVPGRLTEAYLSVIADSGKSCLSYIPLLAVLS